MRALMLPLVVTLSGCGRSPCDKEADIRADCGQPPQGGASTAEAVCEPESREECFALCAIDARDARGCDGIFEGTLNGDYLTCLGDCA